MGLHSVIKVDRKVLREALGLWGSELQMMVAIEELAESILVLIRILRGRHWDIDRVTDEVADSYVVLAQMMEVFSIHDAVQAQVDFKINRLKGLCEDEESRGIRKES